MDDWEKLNETSLPEKKRKDFYSKLNMEYITDTDYAHAFAKILYKNFRGLS